MVSHTYAVLAGKMLMTVVALALLAVPSLTTQLMLRLLSAPEFGRIGAAQETSPTAAPPDTAQPSPTRSAPAPRHCSCR